MLRQPFFCYHPYIQMRFLSQAYEGINWTFEAYLYNLGSLSANNDNKTYCNQHSVPEGLVCPPLHAGKHLTSTSFLTTLLRPSDINITSGHWIVNKALNGSCCMDETSRYEARKSAAPSSNRKLDIFHVWKIVGHCISHLCFTCKPSAYSLFGATILPVATLFWLEIPSICLSIFEVLS